MNEVSNLFVCLMGMGTTFVGLICIMGLPPFTAFFSKYLMIQSAIHAGHPALAALIGTLFLEPMFRPYMPKEDSEE